MNWLNFTALCVIFAAAMIAALIIILRQEKEMIRIRKKAADMKDRKDAAYFERNQCVALIARMAIAMGLKAYVTKTAIEGWSEDWHGCVFIDLPAGQVSWHFHDSQAHLFQGIPRGEVKWDGHSTEEKYRRVLSAFPTSCPTSTAASAPSSPSPA